MALEARVTVTRLVGSTASVSLPMPDDVSAAADGATVTFTWNDYLEEIAVLLGSWVCRRPVQQQTRAGLYVVTADGGNLVKVDWSEWRPFGGTLISRSLNGVVQLPGRNEGRQQYSTSMIAYQASRLYRRAEGSSEVLP